MCELTYTIYGTLPSFLSETALSAAARFGPAGVVSTNCSAMTLKRILPPCMEISTAMSLIHSSQLSVNKHMQALAKPLPISVTSDAIIYKTTRKTYLANIIFCMPRKKSLGSVTKCGMSDKCKS